MQEGKHILILGGGFAGVCCAKELGKAVKHGLLPSNTKISLVSERLCFEYHGSLYKIVSGGSPMQVSIPLEEVFKGLPVSIVHDTVTFIDYKNKQVRGLDAGHYSFDYLVTTLGSEATYFNIPGLKEYSFSFRSTNEALKLRQHLEKQIAVCLPVTPKTDMSKVHVVIIGAGASGVEVAAELSLWTKRKAKELQVAESCVQIDLVEAAPRILPSMPAQLSAIAEKKLKSLGVNIYTSRAITSETEHEAVFGDMAIKSETVVWTAGVVPHRAYAAFKDVEKDKKGRIVVNDQLAIPTYPYVYVGGDAAATKYAGYATTAAGDGVHIAHSIVADMRGWVLPVYEPKQAPYILPLGPRFAIYSNCSGTFVISGFFAFILRRRFDMRVYRMLLPTRKALNAFWS